MEFVLYCIDNLQCMNGVIYHCILNVLISCRKRGKLCDAAIWYAYYFCIIN